MHKKKRHALFFLCNIGAEKRFCHEDITTFDEYADTISLQQIKNLPHKHGPGRVRPLSAIHAVPGLRQLHGLVVTLVPAVQLQLEQRVF